MIFIAENGSYVVCKGEDMLVVAMEPAITREQLLEARNIPHTYVVLCGKKKPMWKIIIRCLSLK
jgi:hypothetical protein